jgi:hypothetical protein
MEDDADFYRHEWMSDDQWECVKLHAQIRGGFHHVGAKFKPFGSGVSVKEPYGNYATFDYSDLTRLVVLAHDRMIRVEVRPGGKSALKFCMWKRHMREGAMHERHPTIEDATASIRAKA